MPSFDRKLTCATLPFGLSQVICSTSEVFHQIWKTIQQMTYKYSPREKKCGQWIRGNWLSRHSRFKAFQHESWTIRTIPWSRKVNEHSQSSFYSFHWCVQLGFVSTQPGEACCSKKWGIVTETPKGILYLKGCSNQVWRTWGLRTTIG